MVSQLLLSLSLILALIAAPAAAGSITIDFGAPVTLESTEAQDAAVQRLVDLANAQITAQNAANAAFNAENPRVPQKTISPFVTREQYVRDAFLSTLQSWEATQRQADATTACEMYRALIPLKQAAINADLGGKSPCQ